MSILNNKKNLLKKYILITIFVAVIETVLPYTAKWETDQLVNKGSTFLGHELGSPLTLFIIIIGIIGLISFIEIISSKIKSYFENIYTGDIEEKYILELIKRLYNMPLGMYLNKRNQKFISSFRTGDFIYTIQSLLIDGFITNIIHLAGIVVAFSYINIWLLPLVFISVGVSFYIDKNERRTNQKNIIQAQFTHENKLRDIKRHLIDSFDKIKISGGYQNSIKTFDTLVQEKRLFEKNKQKKGIFFSLLTSGNITVSEFCIKLIIGYIIISGGASIGVMVMTLMYINQIRGFFNTIFFAREKWDDLIDELQRIELYISMTQPDNKNKIHIGNSINKIEVKNLCFSYPTISPAEIKAYEILIKRLKKYGEKRPAEWIKDRIHFIQDAFEESKHTPPLVLSNLSLGFYSGKMYGIVGHNGAGKTTLSTLLMNYFRDYAGSIQYNNTNIKDISYDNFDSLFGVITQEPFILYCFSVRDNLLFGVEKKYSDEEIYTYLEYFGLKEKIEKLRKGLDTDIGYDSDFSGGQKQLIVLIRIILQDRPILIIDEGTNQLDAINEMKVMEELLKNKKNKIIICITHRMTTMRRMDEIICIENGHIGASGNHETLVHGDNIYATFWKKQVEQGFNI